MLIALLKINSQKVLLNIFNITKEDLYQMFSSKQKIIKGGNLFEENFEKQKKTVNLENAVVAGYKNL